MRVAVGIALVAIMVLGAHPAAAQHALKIGYVDYYRVVNESEDGKKANDALTREFEPLKNDLKVREAAMKKLEQEIKRQQDVLSPETLREKRDTLRIKVKSYYIAKKDARERFTQRNAKLLKPILEDLKEVVKEIGQEGKFTMIFENSSKSDDLLGMQSNILYASSAIDITDKVLAAFNARKRAARSP